MVTDIPALARTLHNASASSEEKLRAAKDLSTALFSSESASQAVQIPELLRSHYISSLLDWLLNAVGRNGRGATTRGSKIKNSGGKSTGAATQTDQETYRLWKMLVRALENRLISPERPLPATFLTNITAAVHQVPSQTPSKSHQLQLCNALEKLLRLLGTKFSASFKPALEPTAALVEAALADQVRNSHPGVGAAALELLVPLLKEQPNPRKSWDAVVPRLFSLLINAGFSLQRSTIESPEKKDEQYEQLKTGCREALSCAIFSQAHVASIADAASMALVAPKVEKPSAKEAVAIMFKVTPKPSRLYTSQVFTQLGKLIEAATAVSSAVENKDVTEESAAVVDAGVFLALPWMVEQYCVALNRYKRAAEIAAAIASHAGLRPPTGGAGAGDGAGSSKEKETRSIGGVAVDADFTFFTALTSILQKKLNSIGKAIRQTETYDNDYTKYRAVQKSVLLTLSAISSTLKPSHIYRPTEDPESKHRQWLADLVNLAIRCSTPNDEDDPYGEPSPGDTANTTASLKVLEAILAVEHRGVQPHLPLLWPMLWSGMPPLNPSYYPSDEAKRALEKHKAQEESDFLIQTNVATSLVHAYGELRQLEVLLTSLVRAVRGLTTSCSAAARLVTCPVFLKVLKEALGSVPSGQVAALVRMVTSWIPALNPSTSDSAKLPAAVLLIADLGAACLAALHVDVITAPAVADALGSLICGLSPLLSSRMGILPEAAKRTSSFGSPVTATGAWECISGSLMLYRQALKLHTLCCLLHPEVISLPGQELYLLNKENQPSGGYFNAVLNGGETIARPMVIDFNETGSPQSNLAEPEEAEFWNLAKKNPPSYFKATMYMAAAQRLETLHYRKIHAQHTCDPGSSEREGSDGAPATTTVTALALLEHEIAFLGKILLGNVHNGSWLPGSPPPALISLNSFSLSSCFKNGAEVAKLPSALILHNQVVLDALLESSLCNDEVSLSKIMKLLLTRFQFRDKEGGTDGAVEDPGSYAMQRALSKPSVAAIAPLEMAKQLLDSLDRITYFFAPMAVVSGKNQQKKKKTATEVEKDDGDQALPAEHVNSSPVEKLVRCISLALCGEFDQKEVEKAFSETVDELAELGGHSTMETTVAAGSLAAHSTRSGCKATKRKAASIEDHPEQVDEYIFEDLKRLDFVLSRVFLLGLQNGGLPSAAAAGVEAVATAAIAASAVALKCIFISKNKEEHTLLALKIITKAMTVVATVGGNTSAEAPLLSLKTPSEALKCFGNLLTAVETTATTVGSVAAAEKVRESVKNAVRKLALDVLNTTISDRSDGSVVLLGWIEDTLTSGHITASLAVLVEGVMAACEEYLLNLSTSSASPTAGESFAISLLSSFEAHAPSLTSLSTETENFSKNFKILNSLAACAAHIINIRCLAPAAIAEKIEKLPAISNKIVPRMAEDIPVIATVLTNSDSNLEIESISGFLCYLEAACLATGAMKPAATSEHFTGLLCLILHILALLPINSEDIDPVRRTIPLSAAFPASRTSSDSATGTSGRPRAAALGALQTLLAGSNSQQLRDAVAFVEKTLSTSTASTYLLPITELSLMALEASRGKAALTTLAQRAERLTSALTATLYNAACPLPQTHRLVGIESSSRVGITSFAALYAAFLNTPPIVSPKYGNSNGDNNDQSSSWTTRQIPSNSTSSSFTSKLLACGTALRALESIVARPKAFQLSSRHLARILNFIDILGTSAGTTSAVLGGGGNKEEAPGLLSAFNPTTASIYANVCHLLTAFARHRESELGRCLPVFGHAVRALLIVLVKWEASNAVGNKSIGVRVYCAEALAAVMAEIANLKASEKYCPHILADYLILAACPVTPTALNLLGSPTSLSAAPAAEDEEGDSGQRSMLLCSPQIAVTLRQGAYAVYGACGTAGVQYVYASFGSRGSGGVWRSGLAALKADHDKSFKYTGKV
ncbi:hypothetical protein Ndes2437B_g01400 [Nannochloris sp. 'desiccata']